MRGWIAGWEDSRFELSIEAVRRSEIEAKEFVPTAEGNRGGLYRNLLYLQDRSLRHVRRFQY
jgi:hypothetical protein